MRTPALFLCSVFTLGVEGVGFADEKEEEKDPNVIFSAGFQGEGVRAGNVPSSFEVVDGNWEIVELRDGKPYLPPDEEESDDKSEKPKGIEEGAFQLLPEPVVDASVRLGPFQSGSLEMVAKVRAVEKNRVAPRFAIGLYSDRGYRLRVSPAKGIIELQRSGGNEEPPVGTASFEWNSGDWYFLELVAEKDGATERWELEGRVWKDGVDRPEKPQLAFQTIQEKMGGKAFINANAYSGEAIQFDEIVVKKIAAEKPKESSD